jgi:hypothetical protein
MGGEQQEVLEERQREDIDAEDREKQHLEPGIEGRLVSVAPCEGLTEQQLFGFIQLGTRGNHQPNQEV